MRFRGSFLPFSCFSQTQGKPMGFGGQKKDPGFGVAVAIWLDGELCVRGFWTFCHVA